MKYLLDSNVWLETAVQGPASKQTADLLSTAKPGTLATTDFAVHTMGLVLAHRSESAFRNFLDDLIRHRVFTLHLTPSDMYAVVECMKSTGLDFDDGFQYVAAQRFALKIVSLDSDFDRAPAGRMTPDQALAEILKSQAT